MMEGWDMVAARMEARRKQLGLSYQAMAERSKAWVIHLPFARPAKHR